MKISSWTAGLLQAAGVTLYVVLFVLVLQSVIPVDAKLGQVAGPIFMLLAFATSALICSSIVFIYPIQLFFNGHKTRAVQTVLWTAGWLVLIFAALAGWFILS